MKRFPALLAAALGLSGIACAQCAAFGRPESEVSRPVLSIYSIEAGAARNLSTYLSPLWYEGSAWSVAGSWTKSFNRWSDRCVMRFETSLDLQTLENPARNSEMWGATGGFAWGLSWRHRFPNNLEVTAGPMLDIYGGALYLARNGNNPVSALAWTGIDAAASLSWEFRIGKVPARLSDHFRLPAAGAFFNPEYGQSYYEIYLGERGRLAHFGWPGNALALNNLLELDLDLGRTGLQLGYRLDLRTFRANHLQTQVLRNAFVIGVIPNL